MSRVVRHTPAWEPADLPVDAAGNTKPGFRCVHPLENGNGPCGGNVFSLDQAIGDHACVVADETRRDTGPAVPPLGAVLSAAVAVVADVRNRGGVDRKTLSRWLRADQDLLAALDAAVEAAAPGAADELVRIWRSAR